MGNVVTNNGEEIFSYAQFDHHLTGYTIRGGSYQASMGAGQLLTRTDPYDVRYGAVIGCTGLTGNFIYRHAKDSCSGTAETAPEATMQHDVCGL